MTRSLFKFLCCATISSLPVLLAHAENVLAQKVLKTRPRRSITTFALTKDDSLLVTLCSDGSVRVWDVKSGKLKSSLNSDYKHDITRIAAHPNGRLLVTGERGGAIRVWDLESAKQIQLIGPVDAGIHRIWCLQFRADGKELLICNHKADLVLASVHKTMPPIKGKTIIGKSVCANYSRDGKWVVFRDELKQPPAVVLWNAATRKRRSIFHLKHIGDIDEFIVSPEAKSIFVRWRPLIKRFEREGRITQLAFEKKKILREYKMEVSAMALSPDGKFLALANENERGCIRLYDAATGVLLRKLAGNDFATVRAIQFTNNNETLIAALADEIFIWDVRKMPVLNPIK